MADLVMERRISHLRKAVDATPTPAPRLVYELMQALLESGDRRGAIDLFRRFERDGNTVTAELIAAYNSALWSQLRRLPTNLPKPRYSFVGRLTELDTLAAELRSEGRAQIIGPGGIGKSRLALEISRRSIGDFADGVWWANLSAAGDDAALCARVAREMRLEDRAYDVASLAARIGAANMLLVLDCCEAAPRFAADLANALLTRCPNVAVIATSRVPLAMSGGVILELKPLSLPVEEYGRFSTAASDALRFFLERAVDADADFVMDDWSAKLAAEICRMLGGVPLGIELACAYLAHADIQEIHRRLLRNGLGDVANALADTMRWTYQLLEPDDRTLLRALSVFDHAFTIDDAVAIAATADARGGVERLARASILVSDRSEGLTWYRLLDTTRAFAYQELEASGESARARRRLVERMLEMALECEARMAQNDEHAAKQLAPAHGNIITALEIASATPTLAEHGLRIAGAVAMHLGVVGLAAQTVGPVERQIEAARRFGRDRGPFFDAALEALSWLENRLSRSERAAEINEERIARARASGNVCKVARALASSVIACVNAGAYDRARQIAVEAVTRSRECGEVSTRARALRSLASFYLNMNEIRSALPLYEEFFGLDELQIPPMQVAMALHDYGFALQNLGDRPRARILLEKCIDRALAIDDYSTATHAYQTLAHVHLDNGDCALALEQLRSALDLSSQGINFRTQLDTFEDFCCAAIRDDQLERLAFVLGFVDAARERIHFQTSPNTAPRIELIRSVVKSRVPQAAYDAAVMRGRLANVEEVTDCLRTLRPGDRPPQNAERFSVLTPREREIAELAGRGQTNRAIAEVLCLSVRTVDVHVASILRKLGIDRRDQIFS